MMVECDKAGLSPQQPIEQTQQWIKTVVIGQQFCPFASNVYITQSIHYQVVEQSQMVDCLQALITECLRLDQSPEIETTLLIFPACFHEFDEYLDFLGLAEQLLLAQGYEGTFQLASFHPRYQFADSEINDPANYTNRSPYPMLHLLRETSLERAISDYSDSSSIPQRNIQHARMLGKDKLAELLERSLRDDKSRR